MKKIIPWSQAHFMSNEKYHLNKAFNSTWISGGSYVTKFEKEFREKYPTFDGHLYLHDLNHFTAEESKILDKYQNMDYDLLEELEDDYDDIDDADSWKNSG